jgi:hypothetical protein
MEDEFDAHREAVDPAKAFDDLRAEVSVMRRTVETLPDLWKGHQAPDYSPDLGRLTKALGIIASHVNAMEQHPAFGLTPESHRLEMAKAGEALMLDASRKLAQATQEAARGRDQIASLIGTARRQDEQRRWVMYTGGVALVLGILLSPIIAAILPFGLDSRVAALILLQDRWHAGEALMQAADPNKWHWALDVLSLGETNQKALAACRTEAVKTKREQRCVITVPAQ